MYNIIQQKYWLQCWRIPSRGQVVNPKGGMLLVIEALPDHQLCHSSEEVTRDKSGDMLESSFDQPPPGANTWALLLLGSGVCLGGTLAKGIT